MGDTGFEPIGVSSIGHRTSGLRTDQVAALSAAARARKDSQRVAKVTDPRLQTIVESWEQLPEQVKDAIAVMMEHLARPLRHSRSKDAGNDVIY